MYKFFLYRGVTVLRTSKGISLFQWIVNFSTIVALLLQCINIPMPLQKYIPYVAYVVIFLSILSIVFGIITRGKSVFTRAELIQVTKNRMVNSTGKIVMFGGDLSWADDYIDIITKLTNNSQVVEIIFPMEKIANAKRSVITRFEKRVATLQAAGATIYCSIEDYHLRCTLIDVEPGRENEDLCVISSKRIYTDTSDSNKNKYQTNILEYANNEERALCNSFYRNYCLIMKLCSKYC